MPHFVLTPPSQSCTDSLHGCPAWTILQSPDPQGADVSANPETPKGFWSLPEKLPCLLARDLCVGGAGKKDAVEVCYYLFMGNS